MTLAVCGWVNVGDGSLRSTTGGSLSRGEILAVRGRVNVGDSVQLSAPGGQFPLE